MQDTYSEVKTLNFPGMVVKVYSPVLSDEERKSRMKNIHNAAAKLLMEAEKVGK